MVRTARSFAFSALVAGCAPIEPPPHVAACVACEDARDRSPAPDVSASYEVTGTSVEPASIRLGGPSERWETERIGAIAAPELSGRPVRARRVHLELKDTPFDEAARLLSDVGGFAVVVEATSASPVTASLRDVEPFDALVALAEARGVHVRYARGVAIVVP